MKSAPPGAARPAVVAFTSIDLYERLSAERAADPVAFSRKYSAVMAATVNGYEQARARAMASAPRRDTLNEDTNDTTNDTPPAPPSPDAAARARAFLGGAARGALAGARAVSAARDERELSLPSSGSAPSPPAGADADPPIIISGPPNPPPPPRDGETGG